MSKYEVTAYEEDGANFVYFTPVEFARAGRGMRFRSSMPDREAAQLVAAASELLEALKEAHDLLVREYGQKNQAVEALIAKPNRTGS